jgi:hypothetical protein
MTTMTNTATLNNQEFFYCVHPLHDTPEEKCNMDGLGLMKMSSTVKYSLLTLRLYLILMGCLVGYRALLEMGVLG